MLLTAVLAASVSVRGVGGVTSKGNCRGEREFQGQDCRGQVLGMQCLFGGHAEVLVM